MMSEDQTCPLCGRILYEGLEGWLYHMNDNDSPCVINSYTPDELKQATSQICRIRQEAKQEVFDDIEKERIRIGSSDETNCFMKLYPHDWKEIKKKHLPSLPKKERGEHGVE